MLKIYVKPETERRIVEDPYQLCVTSLKGQGYSRFGSDYPEEAFGNSEWVNEKINPSTNYDWGDVVGMDEDEEGSLDSR